MKFKDYVKFREGEIPNFQNREEYEKWKAELKKKELEMAKKSQEEFLKRAEQLRKSK